MTSLQEKVLRTLEPDPARWKDWLEPKSLASIARETALKEFRSIMEKARQEKQKVFVAGDYDCDGLTATSIMVMALRRFGMETGFYVPDRFREGYGLKPETVQKAADKGYSVLVTVDNGVRQKEALARAQELGLQVIVTDHHLIGEDPVCSLLVHPNTLGENFRTLCGAGLAFECARALGTDDAYLLMLAMVGSIGDMMEVRAETRAIIQLGLQQFNRFPEPHLRALCPSGPVNETDISFQVVPRINSAGRLADHANANNVVRYFLSRDAAAISQFAKQLDKLNTERKNLSAWTAKRCEQCLQEEEPFLLIKDPEFHEGIVGLAAGALCQAHDKPVAVATAFAGGFKGSMRAPAGFDCVAFFADFPDFDQFGGHAQAAGFSIAEENWEALESYIRAKMADWKWEKPESSVLEIEPRELNVASIASLDALRPFGTGFKMPTFVLREPQVVQDTALSGGLHKKFILTSGLECLRFRISSQETSLPRESIAAFYGAPSISVFRGTRRPNFLIDRIEGR